MTYNDTLRSQDNLENTKMKEAKKNEKTNKPQADNKKKHLFGNNPHHSRSP